MGTLVNFNPGWNAGARSIKWVDSDCEATLEPPASLTDAFAGLSRATDVTSIVEPTHAFRFTRTPAAALAYVYERGVLKSSLGAYVDGDVFKIRRTGGQVRYYKNGTLVYTSASQSTGRAFLSAALYMGGDRI